MTLFHIYHRNCWSITTICVCVCVRINRTFRVLITRQCPGDYCGKHLTVVFNIVQWNVLRHTSFLCILPGNVRHEIYWNINGTTVSNLQEYFYRLLRGQLKLFLGYWLPFFCSLSWLSHTLGGQSMTDSVPVCVFLSRCAFTALARNHCHAEKWNSR